MIRAIIEPDIDEIQQLFKLLQMKNDSNASRAWTRLQIKLYRYSDLLEHLKTLPNPSEELKRTITSELHDLTEEARR